MVRIRTRFHRTASYKEWMTSSHDPHGYDLHGLLRLPVEREQVRDVELVRLAPIHPASMPPCERIHEIEGFRHMERVHALREGHGLLQERAVRMRPLASERRVHDDGVRSVVHIPYVRQLEVHLRSEEVRIRPRGVEGLLRCVVSDDHAGVEHPRPDGEHPRAASEVHDLQPLDVPVAVRLEQQVRRDRRGRYVLLQGDIRLGERLHALQRDLQLPLPHRPCMSVAVISPAVSRHPSLFCDIRRIGA